MEQVNQEIKAYLQVFMSHHQDDWADWLPLAKFAYNNHVHSATHHTLFELDSGQDPQMGSEPSRSSAVEAADDFAQLMSQMQDKVKAALEHAADKMAQYYDHQRSPAPAYEVRAKVWLNAQNYMTTCLTVMVQPPFFPFLSLSVPCPISVTFQLHPTLSACLPPPLLQL